MDVVNDTASDAEVILINDNNGEFAMPIAIKSEDVLTGSEKFTVNVSESTHHDCYGLIEQIKFDTYFFQYVGKW